MADVAAISAAPRPSGSAANARVRGHLIRRMQVLGLTVSTTSGMASAAAVKRLNGWSGRNDAALRLTNIVGILPGKDRARPALLLMAHHDSVWGSPGAADDAAGVASALEVARAIRAGGRPDRDLILLFTDGEELGLEGAHLFFSRDPLRHRVGAVINMEARGGGGRATLFQTSRNNGEAARLYARSVERPAGSSLAAFVYSVLPNDTDLTPVLAGPTLAYNLAFIGRPGLYHSPAATAQRLDQGALQDMGAQVLDLSRALLSAKRLPGPVPDTVFFDAFGRLMIVYPPGFGWVMLGIGALGIGLALRRDADLWAMAGGAGRMLGLMLVAGLAFTLLNLLSGAGAAANYYDRLAAIPLLELMVVAAGLALALLFYPRRLGRPAALAGTLLPFWLIGVAAQWIAPTAAYVVLIPLMLVAPVVAATPALRGFAVAMAALIIGYMLALGHQLMQGVGPSIPAVASLPLGLFVLALLPLWLGLSGRVRRTLQLALWLLALGTALWIRFDPVADTIAVYSADKR